MGFVAFTGRFLFAAIFLINACRELIQFGTDGGRAARRLEPKFNVLIELITYNLGVALPHIEIMHVAAVNIALKGLGALLFIFFSSSLGAYLLLVFLAFYMISTIVYAFSTYRFTSYDFNNDGIAIINFIMHLTHFGALLFFVEMNNYRRPRRQLKKKTNKSKTN